MRTKNKLSARTVATLSKPGRHGDGAGLYLSISKNGDTIRRRWVYLFTWQGKLREMGLGGYPDVSLAKVRDDRDRWSAVLKAGKDPLLAREEEKTASNDAPTFGEIADAYVETKASEWRNEKHVAQWQMTLTEYAKPIRAKAVNTISTDDVLSVLKPIWLEKPETALRLRGRIEHVLDAAKAQGYRDGANPALWRGHLDKLLPKRTKLSRGHHAAMPYDKVPDFVRKLREREGAAALALEFAILTAARSGEVLGSRWNEFDVEKKVWTVPARRMKAARIHRVPLSTRTVQILDGLATATTGDFVFPGRHPKKPLSNMALEMVLRRMKIEDATVHGFRSSFRDWCGNETSFSREIAEAALAHVIGDKAEQAYRRGDALEKRRGLMEAWCEFCELRVTGDNGRFKRD
jgi:integrase